MSVRIILGIISLVIMFLVSLRETAVKIILFLLLLLLILFIIRWIADLFWYGKDNGEW